MCSWAVVEGYVPCEDPEDPHVKGAIAEWALIKYHQLGSSLDID